MSKGASSDRGTGRAVDTGGALSPAMLTAVILIGAIAMMAILSMPLFTGQIFLEDDLATVFIPFRHFYAECLKAGEDFIWLPNVYNGFYLQGEAQNGMTHPLHYGLYKYLPFTQAFDLELLISYPFMFIGTILFLRRWKLPVHAVLFGALLMTFSGYPTSRWLYLVHVGVLAHAPWLLFCIDVALRSSRPSRVAASLLAIVGLTTSALLVGYPHMVFIMGLVEGLYALFLLRESQHKSVILLLLWAKILAVFCAAVQLLPTYDLAMHSMRVGMTYESRMWGSQHPMNLLQLVNPYFAQQRTFQYVGYDTLYGGAVTTLLVAWLLIRIRRIATSKAMVACFGIAVVLGLVLTLGHYGYLYRGVSLLPIFSMFRGAARHAAMLHLGWVALATLGYVELHRMLASGERASWWEISPLILLPILSLGVVATVAIVGRYPDAYDFFPLWNEEFAPLNNALMGAGIMAMASLLFVFAARGWKLGLVALVLFSVVDLSVYGLRHKTVGDFEEFRSALEMPPGEGQWGYEPNYLPTYNVMGPAMFGRRTSAGRASIEPARQLDYGLNETPLRLSGVKYIRTRYGTTAELNVLADRGIEWKEITEPMPRARLVSRTLVSENPALAVEQVDIATTAIVENPIELDPSTPGVVTVIEERPGLIRMRADTPSSQVLVLTEAYYPGWRISVDAESAEALRVNGDFVGCVVGAGSHEIEFHFDPDSWRWGKMITAGTLLLSLVFHLGLYVRLKALWKPA